MSFVMAPLSLIAALFVWQWPTWEQLAWLVGIGILGGAGQLAMAEALRVAETHVIMPVDFMKLIWVSAIAYLWFAEVPNAFTLVGGVMIFTATAFIAWREHVMRAAPKPPAEPTSRGRPSQIPLSRSRKASGWCRARRFSPNAPYLWG